eukprot:11636584-Prorocentrum_lima.AAC.1
MTSSLVGSEMCIRDRLAVVYLGKHMTKKKTHGANMQMLRHMLEDWLFKNCLLYTSDAADDM